MLKNIYISVDAAKQICVTRVIKEYEGKLEIVMDGTKEIEIE